MEPWNVESSSLGRLTTLTISDGDIPRFDILSIFRIQRTVQIQITKDSSLVA